jgi:hypothetical protein
MLRPTAIEILKIKNYQLFIKFDNNEIREFNLETLFDRKPFLPLKDINLLKTVHINGISIEFDNDIDICPDELYFNSILIS